MFTIKYRSHHLADAQDGQSCPEIVTHEQVSGPYALVSQVIENGLPVVHAHDEHGDSRCMFGPWIAGRGTERDAPPAPRPTVWVMNASGATVARYDL